MLSVIGIVISLSMIFFPDKCEVIYRYFFPKESRKTKIIEDTQRDWDDPLYIAEFDKNNFRFDIMPIKKGFYNPDEYDACDFSFLEKQLLSFYYTFQRIPQFGDYLETSNDNFRYWVVVGTQLFVDDFEEITLLVVPDSVFEKHFNF